MRLIWILLLVLGGSLTGYLITRFERGDPLIQTRRSPVYVGSEYVHPLSVYDEGTGLESVRIWIQQGDKVVDLLSETYPGNLFTGADSKSQVGMEVRLDPKKQGLEDGQATLHFEARDYSWLGNRSNVAVPLMIDTRAPLISLQTGLTYVRRGGAEAVVYQLNEASVKHGVEVGELFFPGYEHPSAPGRQVAFYVVPADMDPGLRPQVFASDRAGNRSIARIPIEIIERNFPSDRIELSLAFMEKKVNELMSGANGDVLATYLKINNEMRRANAKQIHELCQRSSSDRLWSGEFRQLPNSHVGARFADQRTYVFEGRNVDSQVNQGYDLASTARAPVLAANDGVVIFADPLGIYGNTVIIDHGLGLFSLYGHLSGFAVEKGEAMSKGNVLGKTGTTGLAGGDHLHFAMLVSGVFVDPLEWFDPRWIREHIEPKLSYAALDKH